jgi:hypothetical protein
MVEDEGQGSSRNYYDCKQVQPEMNNEGLLTLMKKPYGGDIKNNAKNNEHISIK